MIVIDASAAIEWLLRSRSGLHIEQRIFSSSERLAAPHLLDVEVLQVVRRLASAGKISPVRAGEILDDFTSAIIDRYPHHMLIHRIWALRQNLTAYDAAYVALAEMIGAHLITCDSRLARTPISQVQIESF